MAMILTVGGVPMYSGAFNSEYDALSNTAMDALFPEGGSASTNEELSAIRDNLILSAESFNIGHDIEGRSTAGLTIKDSIGAFLISERQQFVYSDLDGNEEFAGVVHSCEEIRIPGTNYVFHTVDAVDYNAILDWRIVNYAAENTLAGDAVKALLTTYLVDEGVTAGHIEDGELLTQISFGNKTLKEALDKLAEACGFIYYIDYDLSLNFQSRTADAADWQISDGDDILSESLTIVRNNPLYRNVENVLGGFEETDLMTETFMGDGTTKSYPMGYAVNRISDVTLTTDDLVPVVTHPSIGEKGAAGTYDFVYGFNSETVSFTVAPPLNHLITITYYGLWRVQTSIKDDSAIAANKIRQGFGTGRIEHAVEDETLTSSTAASEYGSAKLAEYAVDGITVNYKTLRSGLEVGTVQHFDYAGLDVDLLIIRIDKETTDTFTTYSIEGVTGPVNQSWETFFASHFTPATSVGESLDSGAGVAQLYQYTHTYLNADRPDIFARTVVGAAVQDTTWPCFDPGDRANYIEVRDVGSDVLVRKVHTLVDGEALDTQFISYTYLGSSEGNGAVRYFVFYGGDSATDASGTGVVIHTIPVNMTKTMLASWQIDLTYVNGT
jgi:hypothetical protein